mmetsp:Transcript_3807/g.5726  ORF Transcript_3807/g.5726 Transcript_3807/m.5726 type:complete len:88 (+) Transcript_3807:450-713(+)
MDKSNMIIACDDIAQCRQTLFYALYDDLVGEGISEVLEFLVGRGGGDEEASSVSHCCATYEAAAADCSVDYGDVIGEFRFEDGEEIL